MSKYRSKIEKVLSILGDGSRFLDDGILISDESGMNEREVLLFMTKGYYVTVDEDCSFFYWQSTYKGGEKEDATIRRYCGLPHDEVIFERDIFVAGMVEPLSL